MLGFIWIHTFPQRGSSHQERNQLCSRWPFVLPQLECALPCSGWNLPGASICWFSSEPEKCKRLCAHQSQEQDYSFFGWYHRSRICGQVRESTFPRLLQSRAPNPWRDIGTPAQGMLRAALDGRGFVAGLLHIFSTGLLSKKAKSIQIINKDC